MPVYLKCSQCATSYPEKPSRAIKMTKTGKRFCGLECRNKSGINGPARRPARERRRQLGEVECRSCGKPTTCKDEICLACTKSKQVELWLSDSQNMYSLKAGHVPVFIKRWLIAQHGDESCWQCGWAEINPKTGKCPVQIDHINGDSSNNRPENLRRLCPSCHSLTEFFGVHGKGRKDRY